MSVYRCYGVIDLRDLDTTPGAEGPLAPPPGFNGDSEAYRNMIRLRYRDPGARQHLLLAARRMAMPEKSVLPLKLAGPYRDVARSVLEKLCTVC